MGFIEGATTLTSSAGNVLSNVGSATGLSGIANAVTGGLSAIGDLFKGIGGGPKPNVLHGYATYNYILGLGIIPDGYLNNPDSTYMAGAPIPLVCKSASIEPNNRVVTAYGRYEFYIDDLHFEHTIGMQFGNNTNVAKYQFKITEPYSMGLFMIACQTLAQQQGHPNYREAPFLLTVEFRGNKENGMMSSIPGSKRYFPVLLTDVKMTVNEFGSTYIVDAMPYNQIGFSDGKNLFKSDTSAKGKTVQEVLQTGERSLQAVINKRLKQLVEDKIISVADEVIILFPSQNASSSSPSEAAGATEDTTGATVDPAANAGGGDTFTKLGVTKSSKNDTYVQAEGDCNSIGSAELGFDETRKADAPISEDNKVYDDKNKVFVDGNNVANIKEGDFRFRQDTDIPNAINQVIMQSKYVKETLDPGKLTPEGYRDWWRIDVQVYNNGEVDKGTGAKPKIIVYRVIPYKTHASKTMPPNKKAPGFELLEKKVPKEYNYIYTGKNVDILKYNIEIKQGFATIMGADGFLKNQDVKTSAQQGGDKPKEEDYVQPLPQGAEPAKGVIPTMVQWIGTNFNTDKKGGGGQESSATRAARTFHDAITSGTDLYNCELDIIGDPYYLVQGGVGNLSFDAGGPIAPDGSVNWQNQEIEIKINFRTPLDINQSTGLYNFGVPGTAPLLQYSGLYVLTTVSSKFSGGNFTQKLKGWRRPQYENLFAATPTDTFNSTNEATPKEDPAE